MKKWLSILLAGMLMVSGVSAFAAEEMQIAVDGTVLEFEHAPVIVEDRTLVPAWEFADAVGGSLSNTEESVYTFSLNGGNIRFVLGDKNVKVNGGDASVDVPAQMVNDVVYLPLRFVCETANYTVQFYGNSPVYGKGSYIEIKTPSNPAFTLLISASAAENGTDKLLEISKTLAKANSHIVTASQYPEQMNLMIAAGEPAVFFDDGTVGAESFANLMNKDGFFAAIGDEIKEYSPQTWEWIQSDEAVKKLVAKEDGTIIAFPVRNGDRIERFFVSQNTDNKTDAVNLMNAYRLLLESMTEAELAE